MSTAPKHTRRWFQFGLGGMFFVLTFLGVFLGWAGWKVNWIRERHQWTDGPGPQDYVVVGSDDGAAPGLLWLFGERGYTWLRVIFRDSPDEDHLTEEQQKTLQTIRGLYPEARVTTVPRRTDDSL
jgi:hypothetical protein